MQTFARVARAKNKPNNKIMKTLFALAAVIVTGVLLATGCSTSCKNGVCTKPAAAISCTNSFGADLAACPGCTNKFNAGLACTNNLSLNLCPGCTNKLSVAACPGCTNKLTLDLVVCPKDCTNKFSLNLVYCTNNFALDRAMFVVDREF